MKRPRLRRAIEALLIGCGALALAIVAAGLVHRELRSRWDRASFEAEVAHRSDVAAPAPPGAPQPALPQIQPRALDAAPPDTSAWSAARRARWLETLVGDTAPRIALLQIPSLDLSVVVLDGTDEWSLNRGVGRIDGTATPAGAGNLGIAGHRDGFFRALEHVEVGRAIELALPDGSRRTYRVAWTRVVDPSDVSVLDPTEANSLTLVTCYPFHWVGDAPKRFIVRATEDPPPIASSAASTGAATALSQRP